MQSLKLSSSSSSSSSVVCVSLTDVARWVDSSVLSRSATHMYCNGVTVARQLPRAINSKYSMNFSLLRNPLLLPYKVKLRKGEKKKSTFATSLSRLQLISSVISSQNHILPIWAPGQLGHSRVLCAPDLDVSEVLLRLHVNSDLPLLAQLLPPRAVAPSGWCHRYTASVHVCVWVGEIILGRKPVCLSHSYPFMLLFPWLPQPRNSPSSSPNPPSTRLVAAYTVYIKPQRLICVWLWVCAKVLGLRKLYVMWHFCYVCHKCC